MLFTYHTIISAQIFSPNCLPPFQLKGAWTGNVFWQNRIKKVGLLLLIFDALYALLEPLSQVQIKTIYSQAKNMLMDQEADAAEVEEG